MCNECMNETNPGVYEQFKEGLHVVRRGLSSDLIIYRARPVLMQSIGGLDEE